LYSKITNKEKHTRKEHKLEKKNKKNKTKKNGEEECEDYREWGGGVLVMWRGKERTVNMRVPALARNYMLQPTYGKMSSYFHTDKSRWHITVLFFFFSDLYPLYQLEPVWKIHVWIRERERAPVKALRSVVGRLLPGWWCLGTFIGKRLLTAGNITAGWNWSDGAFRKWLWFCRCRVG